MTVVTRIAPSPTGNMHVGTARTALFNYLFAKRHGGKFLLRIEDTDRERSTPEAVDVIHEGLEWLGLKPDGAPVFQFERGDRHREVVEELLANGKAYVCFMTPEEAAEQKKANPGKAFRSNWRDFPPPTPGLTRSVISSSPFVVRFKGPLEGDVVINDLVKGEVRFKAENFDDLVLLRSDGTPTYNLAVVVDDHDMGITHVIRGDDHMNNAGRQKLIYEALGWDVPEFAHLPLINNEHGKPLSKRNGDPSLMDYRDMGYLPSAMRNYLTRLGWGHGDDEIFSDAQAIEWFDVADVVSAPARWDSKKLLHINHHYLTRMADSDLAGFVGAILEGKGIVIDQSREARLPGLCALLKEGAHTLNELADACVVAFRKPVPDEKALNVLLKPESKEALRSFNTQIHRGVNWNVNPATALGVLEAVKHWAEIEAIPMKVAGPAIRVALTGRTTAPDLGTLLVAIGAEESIARIEAAIEQ
jgi:glutamyl-tRNA synthetase